MNDLIESIKSCYTDYTERCNETPLQMEDFISYMLMVFSDQVWEEMNHMTEFNQIELREEYGYE